MFFKKCEKFKDLTDSQMRAALATNSKFKVYVRVLASSLNNRPFAANDHVVQNPPCWRASSLLFPHWDFKTKASQASLAQDSLF